MPNYEILINGVDRTKEVGNRTVTIEDSTGTSMTSATFGLNCRLGGDIPKCDDEVIINNNGERIFGGRVLRVLSRAEGDFALFDVHCIDWIRDLDRNLVVEGYQGMTDKAIIEDIVNNYCGGTDITYDNVTQGVTVNQIVFGYAPPSQCFNEICKLTGRNWYIDKNKDIHYFVTHTEAAPFNITSDEDYKNLQITNDNSAIRNRIYVRGGTYLSDTFTMSVVADGETTVFNLPEKPHDLTVTEGVTSKTVGTKFIHEFTDYDYLVNYQEKYVETDTAPADTTVVTFTFKYNIPVLIAIEDRDSIEDHGQAEFAIFDKNINTIEQARDRATAELTDYAETVVGGRFQTETNGFKAGQYMQITKTSLGIDEEFLIQRVVARSIGGGNFVYTVYVTSATVLGILQFLVDLLEKDKNTLDITSDEVVDEISTITAEEFTLTDGTPVLTTGDGTYVYYEDGARDGEYDLASYKPT